MNRDYEQLMSRIGRGVRSGRGLGGTDKQKMTTAYNKMYAGIVLSRLTQGEQYGPAMHHANEQMKTFVMSKSEMGPAARYLRQMHGAQSVAHARQAMLDENKDKYLHLDKESKNAYKQRAATDVQKAIAEINSVLEKSKEYSNINQQNNQQGNKMSAIETTKGNSPINPTATVVNANQKKVTDKYGDVQKDPYDKTTKVTDKYGDKTVKTADNKIDKFKDASEKMQQRGNEKKQRMQKLFNWKNMGRGRDE